MVDLPGGSWAQRYACYWSPLLEPMGRRLLRALPLAGARRVLDVGTANGQLLLHIRQVAQDADVVGIDTNAGLLGIAAGHINGGVARMDAQRLAFRGGTFDVVIATFVLFQLPEPRLALSELARVLRERGTVGIATWGREAKFPGNAIWHEELDAAGVRDVPATSEPREPAPETPDALRSVLESAGIALRRCWTQRFERSFSAEEIVAMSLGLDARLRQVPPPGLSPLVERVRSRLTAGDGEALVYRPEVVYAVGEPFTR